MWWKIVLITLFLILVLWIIFSIFACVRVGAKSEDDYVLYITKSKHTPVRKRGENDELTK